MPAVQLSGTNFVCFRIHFCFICELSEVVKREVVWAKFVQSIEYKVGVSKWLPAKLSVPQSAQKLYSSIVIQILFSGNQTNNIYIPLKNLGENQSEALLEQTNISFSNKANF